MKLRIVKRWHPGMGHSVYALQRQYLGFYWKELDWSSNLGTMKDMLENYVPTVVEIIK